MQTLPAEALAYCVPRDMTVSMLVFRGQAVQECMKGLGTHNYLGAQAHGIRVWC